MYFMIHVENSLLTLAEPCHIQYFVIFRILAYSGPEAYSEYRLYRHIQAYSVTIVTITLTSFFFYF